MYRRWHVGSNDNVAAEVLLNQVRVQRVRCMWSFTGRAWDKTHTSVSFNLLHRIYVHGDSHGPRSTKRSEIAHLREAFLVAGCRSWPCRRVWQTGSVQSFARWCSVASAGGGEAPQSGLESHTACHWCSPPGWPGLGIASAWSFQGHWAL